MIGVLTEDCTGRIVTGETGLAHTRTSTRQLMSHIGDAYRAAVKESWRLCKGVGASGADSPSTAGMARVVFLGDELTHCR
jgi:hypothetical protein